MKHEHATSAAAFTRVLAPEKTNPDSSDSQSSTPQWSAVATSVEQHPSRSNHPAFSKAQCEVAGNQSNSSVHNAMERNRITMTETFVIEACLSIK